MHEIFKGKTDKQGRSAIPRLHSDVLGSSTFQMYKQALLLLHKNVTNRGSEQLRDVGTSLARTWLTLASLWTLEVTQEDKLLDKQQRSP